MLGEIKTELAKLIAGEIYTYAKQQGADAYRALKKTNLRKGGGGLPAPVLVMFEESFIETLDHKSYGKDGYTRWRQNGGEKEFDFLFPQPLVDTINRSNWAAAAKQTADGVAQIAALGGDNIYQRAVSAAASLVFCRAVAKYRGEFHPTVAGRGWRILSEVLTVAAALEGTTNFEQRQLFFWSYGKEDETKTEYKLAKSLMFSGIIFKKFAEPSAGPFFLPAK